MASHAHRHLAVLIDVDDAPAIWVRLWQRA